MSWSIFSIRRTIGLFMSFGVLVVLANSSQAQSAQVPFGDKISNAIFNYNRTTPFVATSGLIKGTGIAELKSRGFKTVLDLRTASEGTALEQKNVVAAGMAYHNIAISQAAPSQDQIKAFEKLVEDKNNYPILVHCASANRVGAMWTHYRVSKGVAFKHAIQEGRTIGLKPNRESQVRKILGEPAL